MLIQVTNYKEILSNHNLNSLNYKERFAVYCEDFPEMRRLKGLRDCELVQIWDRMMVGFDMQEIINSIAIEWLDEENNLESTYEDLSSELKSFLTESTIPNNLIPY